MINHEVSTCCAGEMCGICARNYSDSVPSTHKVEEEIFTDDPQPLRHPLTQYVCCTHFIFIMGHATPCGGSTE